MDIHAVRVMFASICPVLAHLCRRSRRVRQMKVATLYKAIRTQKAQLQRIVEEILV